jgi:hypothetical protein
MQDAHLRDSEENAEISTWKRLAPVSWAAQFVFPIFSPAAAFDQALLRFERARRLVLQALDIPVAREAKVSEWRRRVGLDEFTSNYSKRRMPH